MIRLGVNIDHVATVRQVRRADEPDPVAAAVLALLGGADGITVHLREDRRHIQDRDVRVLRQVVTRRLNLEMAAVDAIVDIACEILPDEATLVPERRAELTTEGGLDVVAHQPIVGRAVERLKSAGIEVSLFVDPDHRQIETAKLLGAKADRDSDRELLRSPKSRGPRARAVRPGSRRRFRPRARLARPHGPRLELLQRPAAAGPHPRRGGAEHRPQHRFTGGAGRHGAGGKGDEGSDGGRCGRDG